MKIVGPTRAVLIVQSMVTLVGSYLLCDTEQHLEFGKVGSIRCEFKDGFDGVYWYNTNDSMNEQPLLKLENGTKSGHDYESEDFDISVDGSLVIRNVSIQNEHVYRTVVRYSTPVRVLSADIHAIVISKPSHQHPLIDKCGAKQSCYIVAEGKAQITCTVRYSRPRLTLWWFQRTVEGDHAIPCESFSYVDNGLFTSKCSITVELNDPHETLLLVCKADDKWSVLPVHESIILAHFRTLTMPRLAFNETLVRNNSHLNLQCPAKDKLSAVWEKWTSRNGLISSLSQYGFHGTLPQGLHITEDGNLTLNHARVENEGTYICYPVGGLNEGVTGYQVSVYVVPKPPYVIVDGCQKKEYCELHLGPTGNLTCSVEGIRPLVELKWRGYDEMSSQTISFTEPQTTIRERGDVFDISVITKYDVTGVDTSRSRLQCIVTGKSSSILNFQKTFDLLVHRDSTGPPPRLIWMVSFLIIPAVGFILLISCKGFLKKEKEQKNATVDERLPLDASTPFDEKLAELKRALEWRYRTWFSAIKPIPFNDDQTYNVNEIFVESNLQKLSSCNTVNRRKQWERVSSYRNIFTPEYERVILQGDPGFGKTTICLQAVYEWCQEEPQSPLETIQLLILLRLNELREDITIFSAIKKLLLPEDSPISAEDIERIFQQKQGIVLVVDGYDELCVTQDQFKIDDIFNGKRLQNCKVILCTRSAVLPKQVIPQTKWFRLNGFDTNTRQKYISNMLESSNLETFYKIREYLERNPILSDLCDIPLFFVLLAHLVIESESSITEDTFYCNTATDFMKNILKCLYSHMRNKHVCAGNGTLKYENKHKELDKVAYDYLFHEDMNIEWLVDALPKAVGQEHYRELVQLGILVENATAQNKIRTDKKVSTTPVRFCHNIFCEWYAAHHLANIACKPNFIFGGKKRLKLVNFIYVYQFASGINDKAAKVIIENLLEDTEGATLATLCLFEKTGYEEDLTEIIKHLCKSLVVFKADENKLFQRAKMKILETASKKKISIKSVLLDQCYQASKMSSSELSLNSGLRFQCLQTMKKLFIREEGRTVTETEAVQLLQFAASCETLRKLRIIGCLLPPSFENHFPLEITAKVKWTPIPEKLKYVLDDQSGVWKSKVGLKRLDESQYNTLKEQFMAYYR